MDSSYFRITPATGSNLTLSDIYELALSFSNLTNLTVDFLGGPAVHFPLLATSATDPLSSPFHLLAAGRSNSAVQWLTLVVAVAVLTATIFGINSTGHRLTDIKTSLTNIDTTATGPNAILTNFASPLTNINNAATGTNAILTNVETSLTNVNTTLTNTNAILTNVNTSLTNANVTLTNTNIALTNIHTTLATIASTMENQRQDNIVHNNALRVYLGQISDALANNNERLGALHGPLQPISTALLEEDKEDKERVEAKRPCVQVEQLEEDHQESQQTE